MRDGRVDAEAEVLEQAVALLEQVLRAVEAARHRVQVRHRPRPAPPCCGFLSCSRIRSQRAIAQQYVTALPLAGAGEALCSVLRSFTAHRDHGADLATMGTAWNILGGLAGQVSFGRARYFGIGAYTAAYSTSTSRFRRSSSPGRVALLLSTIAAVAVGVPTFRLRGHYFVCGVFIVQAVYIIVSNWRALGAGDGPGAAGTCARPGPDALWHLQFHMLEAAVLLRARLSFSSPALARSNGSAAAGSVLFLAAVREEEDAARSLGVDSMRYKLVALIVSAGFTTLCGMFYAHYVLYVEPVQHRLAHTSAWRSPSSPFSAGSGRSRARPSAAFVIIPDDRAARAYMSGHIGDRAGGLPHGGGVMETLSQISGRRRRRADGYADLRPLIVLIARFQPRGMLGFFRRLD